MINEISLSAALVELAEGTTSRPALAVLDLTVEQSVTFLSNNISIASSG